MKRWLLITALALVFGCPVFAQDRDAPTDADFARKPLWVAMLDDTLANYNTVERAFILYFKRHEMPEGEHDVIGEYAARRKRFSKRKLRRIDRENALQLEVKKYHWWRQQMLPYVQPDGCILTPAERLAVWKTQGGG